MSRFESDDELGNPWMATLIGAGLLVLAWYVYAKIGGNPHLHGKAAIANSGPGRAILSVLFSIVGAFFFFSGIAKLRSND